MEASICVICITYNHEKFLRKALNSFVEQKTNYPFRVIVHDDASSDSTPEIMREYEKNYPELFTMIYEKENQFIKLNKSIYRLYNEVIAPYVNEKYVVLCEGDDYWCDRDKLQLQADYMEKNRECAMCVHDTMFVNVNGENIRRLNGSNEDRDYGMKEVLLEWGRGFHTTSFFCRRELFFNRPDEFTKLGLTDDWQLSIYAASVGKIHYIGRVMSCFRKENPESITGKKDNRKPSEKKDDGKLIIENLTAINEYTHKKFNKLFQKRIRSLKSLALLRQHKFIQALVKYPLFSSKHIAADILRKLGRMY